MILPIAQRFMAGLTLVLATAITPVMAESAPERDNDAQAGSLLQLQVYKSPTCGCCELWINHAQDHGMQSTIHHPHNLDVIKSDLGISPRYQSCHTAVSPEGYVFEGHVPAPLIARFLAEKPENAIGLAVPGMPLGSPGMEMGDRFTPYTVLLLKRDGSSEVYAQVTSPTQTF